MDMLSLFLLGDNYLKIPTPSIVITYNVNGSKIICPTKIEDLVSLLIKDLPDYTNREYLRRSKRNDPVRNSVLTAGKPDFTPLELMSREYQPVYPQDMPKQVFLTTLERQITNKKSQDLQLFHWLFFQRHQNKWYLVSMYSRDSIKQGNQKVISPPQESMKTAIAASIQRWLDDCNTNNIRQ